MSKIKRVLNFFLRNWVKIAEIIVIIWIIQGAMTKECTGQLGNIDCTYSLASVLAHLLSGGLIIYLLKRYEDKITRSSN